MLTWNQVERSFWSLLNAVLAEITGKPEYKFNPKVIVIDENGINVCGVRQAFRLDFVISRVVSCQMHFKHDISKAFAKSGEISKLSSRKYAVKCVQ